MTNLTYQTFLESKLSLAKPVGFDVDDADIHPALFDFQRAVVKWALARGRGAIFGGTGLGKSLMQLEWARIVHAQTQQPVLILAPLAVNAQTVKEGAKIDLHVHHCESQADVINGVNITNYEKLHRFNPEAFGAIVCDESSILKSFDGKTRKQLTAFSRQIYYRLACTATPSPNDLVEITNHAEFLDVMSGKEVIALYFTQDGNTTHKWRLKGHAKRDFYKWMASWCRAFLNPADLGFIESGELFSLPPIEYIEHVVESGIELTTLFPVGAKTLQEQRAARRLSLGERVRLAVDLINAHNQPAVAWCNLNDESQALAQAIPDAVEITGSDAIEHKAKAMEWFIGEKCSCQLKNKGENSKLAIWQNDPLDTGSNTTKNTASNVLQSPSNISAITPKRKRNTCKNITQETSNPEKSARLNSKSDTTQLEESGTPQTPLLGSSALNTQGQEIPKIENTRALNLNSESQESGTSKCLTGNLEDVPFAERISATPEATSSTLTIAIHQEKSEGCYAQTATSALENSRTILPSSRKPSCTCNGTVNQRRVLISKPGICGFGLNFQHCGDCIFVGLSHSFEQFYQAVRRFWRFGRKGKVTVHIIVSDEEINVLENIQRKERQYLDLMANLVTEMKDFQTFQQARNVMEYDNYQPLILPEWIQNAA